YIQFALLLCSLLTVAGVIVLRTTRPNISRPYRVWFYPLPPIVFSAITIWMMIYLLRSKTTESVAGLVTAIIGLLLYFCARRRVSAAKRRPPLSDCRSSFCFCSIQRRQSGRGNASRAKLPR